jgi:signal transduction histidine kinase
MRPNSIRARVTVGFALYIAVLMLLGCTAVARHSRRQAERRARELLEAAVVRTRYELAENRPPGPQHRRNGPTQQPVQQERGQLLLRVIRAEQAEIATGGLVLLVADDRRNVLWQSHGQVPRWPQADDNWRIRTLQAGRQELILALPWEHTEHELREQMLTLLGLTALITVASAAGGWFLVGRTLAPIDQLARQAAAASADSLRVRLQAPSPDSEIIRLVATLNNLLERLGETAAARGRFYAAASHELRTPLQALTGHLEVALSRKRAAADYEAALNEGHAQAERLTSLVQDLLLLNQLDADTSRPPGVLVDLADICESEISHLRSIANERHLKVQLCLPDACEITAPWNHITMLIRNLLENAVKYATPGGVVRIVLTTPPAPGGAAAHHGAVAHHNNGATAYGATAYPAAHTDAVQLTIWNQCAMLEGWDAGKYFEPFFRPDASRNSQTGGNGLGLAICKAICDTNRWTLALQQEAGGMCACVTFAAS